MEKYFKILKHNEIKILVLTQFHKKFLEQLGVDKNKIMTFPNYLDLSAEKNQKIKKNLYCMQEELVKKKGLEN